MQQLIQCIFFFFFFFFFLIYYYDIERKSWKKKFPSLMIWRVFCLDGYLIFLHFSSISRCIIYSTKYYEKGSKQMNSAVIPHATRVQ